MQDNAVIASMDAPSRDGLASDTGMSTDASMACYCMSQSKTTASLMYACQFAFLYLSA